MVVLMSTYMLYKKYHRNHVRQFKKGREVFYNSNTEIIVKEPYFYSGNSTIFFRTNQRIFVIMVCSSQSCLHGYFPGQLCIIKSNANFKVNDAIQKIS